MTIDITLRGIIPMNRQPHPFPLCRYAVTRAFLMACLLVLAFAAHAQDQWNGSFTIIPISAPQLVLAAVDGGTAEGTRVSLAPPADEAARRWTVTRTNDGFYRIRPAHSQTLVLAVAAGGTTNGTAIVLETDTGKPWQSWSIRKTPSGSWSLVPRHAPEQGLDDFAGGQTAGTKIDLWTWNADDEHLQWSLKPLAGATVPDGTVNPLAIPRGTIKEFTFDSSIIFPGTKRSGHVFIPAQYDGSTPACVYVRQDGYNPGEKPMLETLIAAKDMPVTIGVFVRPGSLPSPVKGAMDRRNRCFEYDGMGDNYVRFLVEELLPFVAKTFDLKLSSSGNDRCIAGGSSGGIAAFNAAWERPDAFARVYANSGSFVAFRGGHEFPTLIRKYEPKPIRAYLTTGTRDMENCAGDWFLIDQEMDKALKFSGYDYVFHSLDGGHVAGWNEHFPLAMRFIWKGWPEPVPAGKGAPRVRDVLTPDGKWEAVGQISGKLRSPACTSTGEVLVIDQTANRIQRIGLDGAVTVFTADATQANGLCVGPKDEVYTVSERTGAILCYDRAGQGRVVVDGLKGSHLLARPDGSLYVTGPAEKAGSSAVWLVKDGKKTQVDAGLKYATGLACRPDQWLLAVADGHSRWAYSYQISADGGLINKERFFWLHVADQDDDAGAESVCYAKEGQMFVATRLGIQVCADDGPTQIILPLPDRSRALGVCLGGPGLSTLFATGGGKLWKRPVKVHAVGAFSPWSKVNGTPL